MLPPRKRWEGRREERGLLFLKQERKTSQEECPIFSGRLARPGGVRRTQLRVLFTVGRFRAQLSPPADGETLRRRGRRGSPSLHAARWEAAAQNSGSCLLRAESFLARVHPHWRGESTSRVVCRLLSQRREARRSEEHRRGNVSSSSIPLHSPEPARASCVALQLCFRTGTPDQICFSKPHQPPVKKEDVQCAHGFSMHTTHNQASLQCKRAK